MKNRRIFIMLTVMMIVLSVVASSYQIGENRKLQVNQTVNVSEKFEVNVVTARESSKNLMRFFEENDKRNRVDTGEFRYTTSGISSDGFPDYYAGMYINVDGNLVVLLTEKYKDGLFFESAKGEKAKEEIAAISGQNDIIFGYVKYSMKELLNAMEQIYYFLISDKAAGEEFQITNAGIYDNKNIIEVGLYPLNSETEKWFRENVVDVDFIAFKETGPNAIEATASIRPGGKISAETGNSYFSVGFRAYKGSTEGFVTCGHSFANQMGNVIDSITNI